MMRSICEETTEKTSRGVDIIIYEFIEKEQYPHDRIGMKN